MIHFEHVSKHYGRTRALTDVSFFLAPGELVFLTGHSGAGKSTLLKLIMLLERPTSGQIIINGRSLRKIRGDGIAYYRRQIGTVFQNHQLLYDRTVYDNIALPLIISGYEPNDINRRVRAAIDKVGLNGKEHYSPLSLSGGEQQRVGIARAVVNKPAVLIADEPTGNLDPKLSAEIMDLFEQFARAGVTVLIASHDLPLIARYSHRLLSLNHGMLLSDGSTTAKEDKEPEHAEA